jgi:hypothetical protein
MRRLLPLILLLAAIAFPLAMKQIDQLYYVTMASRILIYALAIVT